MNATLESAARGLDEYARAAEWRCAQLMSMMQPMFDTYKVPTHSSLVSIGRALCMLFMPLRWEESV